MHFEATFRQTGIMPNVAAFLGVKQEEDRSILVSMCSRLSLFLLVKAAEGRTAVRQ
jgi:hypothetical protein